MNKGLIFALITAFMWGFLAIAVKVALKVIPPIELSWVRFSVAFIALSLYYLLFDRSKFGIVSKPPVVAIFAALFLGFNYLGFITGINYTTPNITQIFIQIGPVLLAISGFVFFKEKAGIMQIVGLLLAFGGYAIFYNEQILVLADDIKAYKLGVVWVVLAGIAWSGYAILQKIAVKKFHPMQLNIIIFGVPALAYIPLINFQVFEGHSFAYWILFIYLGLNTLIAYGSLAFAIKYLDANKVSVVIISNPLITFVAMAILGILEVSWITHEKWSVLTVIGMLVILSGILLTVTAHKRKS
ncbi:MAG: DMT family transporter [Bacteroidales bacterium]|nr:DMT family transporter [Bacteroidales bacterium]